MAEEGDRDAGPVPPTTRIFQQWSDWQVRGGRGVMRVLCVQIVHIELYHSRLVSHPGD